MSTHKYLSVKGRLLTAFLLLFLLTFFLQCRKDPFQSWSFYDDSPPPPSITMLNAVVSDCQPPYPVTFTQKTINLRGTVYYYWDFGDGTTSTDQNPHHIYSTPGEYEVKLVVSNEIGADTAYLDMSHLNQSSIPVEADFTYSHFNNNNFAPARIDFSNQSSGANQFYWHFGDGAQANDANPHHVFQNQGNYTVTLRGTCTDGTYNETTRNIFVNPAPTRVFIDSINLMLPSAYRNSRIFIDLYHNTTLIGTTVTRSPSSFPVKFKSPGDFMMSYFFDYVQFTSNEVFEFWIMKEVDPDPPILLYRIVLASVDIQNNHYPRAYFQVETVPALHNVFIDLYFNY